jgi:hypothetical protein
MKEIDDYTMKVHSDNPDTRQGEELPYCTRSRDPESHRLSDDDGPCRDGETL